MTTRARNLYCVNNLCHVDLLVLLDRELVEAVMFESGDLRLRDVQQLTNLALFELARLQQLVDGQRQARLGLPLGGVGQAEVGEDVGRAARDVVVGGGHGVALLS